MPSRPLGTPSAIGLGAGLVPTLDQRIQARSQWVGRSTKRRLLLTKWVTAYTAKFNTQYFLAMAAGIGGTVTPASGWKILVQASKSLRRRKQVIVSLVGAARVPVLSPVQPIPSSPAAGGAGWPPLAFISSGRCLSCLDHNRTKYLQLPSLVSGCSFAAVSRLVG